MALLIIPPSYAVNVINKMQTGKAKHPYVTTITLLRILPVAHPRKEAIMAVSPKISKAMKNFN